MRPGEGNAADIFLSCVNPVVTSYLPLIIKFFKKNVIYCRLSFPPLSSPVNYSLTSSHPLAFVSSKFLLFSLPATSKPWTGITGIFPHSSRRTPVCACGLFANAVRYVHGFLSNHRGNVFRSSLRISSSPSLQISHPLPHQRHR